MSSRSKSIITILFLLFIYACLKDLSHVISQDPHSSLNSSYLYYDHNSQSFQVISYQVQQGDQWLSIIEQINDSQIHNIEQAMTDFLSLNPKADPYQLKIGRVYLFPVYHENG
ncbi:hypothetical protein [Amphibacillus sediminis]|uniref:hypothetical protein n=1 Tax=Amphibacillus sediminis TaxID=360185 RepID=UPI00082BA9D9|nr:hypothetical protein [Amphibacillus sediminis]